jgi:hypothetical protein
VSQSCVAATLVLDGRIRPCTWRRAGTGPIVSSDVSTTGHKLPAERAWGELQSPALARVVYTNSVEPTSPTAQVRLQHNYKFSSSPTSL